MPYLKKIFRLAKLLFICFFCFFLFFFLYLYIQFEIRANKQTRHDRQSYFIPICNYFFQDSLIFKIISKISSIFKIIIKLLCLFQVDLQVIVVSPDNYTASLSQMDVNADVVTRDVNNAPPAQDVHLVIAADILSNRSYTILKNLVAALKSGCFILLEETAAQLDLKTALKETDLALAGKQTDPVGKTYLLLKKREKRREPIVIQITEKNLSWLEDVKVALKKSENENQEVLLISQGEETLGKITEKNFSNHFFNYLV